MLPVVRTDEEWQAVVWDEEIVRPAAEDLAGRLGLAGTGLRRYPGGSRPVYAAGGRRVLKLYPTVSAPDGVTEARVLEYLHGRLPVATPALMACGEYENGWRYVLMSRLPGTELAAAWPAIPRPDQDRIASQADELLAALHALDPGPLHGILGPADWPASSPASARRPRSGSARVKLPHAWLSQIEGFLTSVPAAPGRERALLHAEMTREHLLVDPGTWTLSGLLDFETAMAGDRAYSSPRPACSSRVATRACSVAFWPPTAAASTRGNCSRTPFCTGTPTCPNASPSSPPRPSSPWIPWPGPGSVPHRPATDPLASTRLGAN